MVQNRTMSRRKRYLIWLGAALLPGISIFVALLAHQSAPDYYTESRAALTTARQHLQLAYGEGQALEEDLAVEHSEIEKALQALQQADLSGEKHSTVVELTAQLKKLEQPQKLAGTTPEQLHHRYERILADLQRLIDESH